MAKNKLTITLSELDSGFREGVTTTIDFKRRLRSAERSARQQSSRLSGRFDMRKIALTLAVLGTTLLAAFHTAPAHAQATRTWVSGVGDDANPCSRTAPCKTWAGAISKTAAGGEIDALDPGGFGALTITKSITLDGGGGQVASVLVAGTNGIVISAGSTAYVTLRNLRFNGLLGTGTPGLNGVSVLVAAQVTIDNCDIFGFNTAGLSASGTAYVQVRNSTFRNNAIGISATGTSGFVVVQVYNSSFVGTQSSGTYSQGGVNAGTNSSVVISNSNFQTLSYGAQVAAGGILNVENSLFASMKTGINAASGTIYPTNVNNNSFYNMSTVFGGAGSYVSANNNKIADVNSLGATPSPTMTVK